VSSSRFVYYSSEAPSKALTDLAPNSTPNTSVFCGPCYHRDSLCLRPFLCVCVCVCVCECVRALCVCDCGVIDSLLPSTWGGASLTQPLEYGHNERTWLHISLALLASQFPLWETAQGLHSEWPHKGPDSLNARQAHGQLGRKCHTVRGMPIIRHTHLFSGPPNPVNLHIPLPVSHTHNLIPNWQIEPCVCDRI